ncbi:hypothetical protein PTKIN_Ptkin10aG0058400 [Pterospermum kingtungense]
MSCLLPTLSHKKVVDTIIRDAIDKSTLIPRMFRFMSSNVDITLIASTVFSFNAHHMMMDSGTADHTKWVSVFHEKQDFIDVVDGEYQNISCYTRMCSFLLKLTGIFNRLLENAEAVIFSINGTMSDPIVDF